MGETVLLLTHRLDEYIRDRYRRLAAEAGRAVVILYNRGDDPVPDRRLPPDLPVFSFDLGDLRRLGYPRKGLQPSGRDIDCFVLLYARAHPPAGRLWVVEYDVDYGGRWGELFDAFAASGADLLATTLQRYAARPDWENWRGVRAPKGRTARHLLLSAFLPCYRLSPAALAVLESAYRAGWSGHYEATVPTILSAAGLVLEDLGGDGVFVAPGNRNRFYTNTPAAADLSPGSFVFRPARTTRGREPGLLWHPVKPPVGAGGWPTGRRARLIRWARRLLRRWSGARRTGRAPDAAE